MAGKREFDHDLPTPTELIEHPTGRSRAESEALADHNEIKRHGKLLAELQRDLTELKDSIEHLGAHRFERQWRSLRKYIGVWIETGGVGLDKFLKAWLGED